MDFLNILACDSDVVAVLSIVKTALTIICWAVPVLLIVLTTIDVAKVVTAGNIDEKIKKEVGNKVATRVIYAVVIFLIPTIVTILFKILGSNSVISKSSDSSNAVGCTWDKAWDEA